MFERSEQIRAQTALFLPHSIQVSVFKQQTSPKGGNWVDAQVDPRTNIDIENAILTRARQLRIAQGG